MATLIALTAVVSRGATVAPGQTFAEADPAEVAWLVREGAAVLVPSQEPAASAAEDAEVLAPRVPTAKSKR